ncbi:MAG: hypothetical protein KAT90_12130 [Gammaproteobacteria bacterium]|nr:hypothetical protein [Gammaproteobacteria bacterium]
MNNGWISIHRKFKDWEWYGDSKIVHLFLHCLLKANHKPSKWRGQDIDAGQFITSQPHLAEETHLSVMQVRTILNKLKLTGELTVKITNKYSIISITNWDSYQSDNRLVNSQVTGNQQSSNSQVTTNNNNNNNKNKKNDNKKPLVKDLDYSCWPSLPDKQIMDDWLIMRKRLKAPVSQTVINRLGKHLYEAVNAGYSINDCMGEAVTRNWKGFKLEWMQNSASQNNNSSQKDENAAFRESLNGGDSSSIDGEFHERK